MDKITASLEKFLLPISEKISGIKILQAVAQAFVAMLPVTIVGSVAYLVANFPIASFTNWLATWNGVNYFMIPYNLTIGLMALYLVVLVAYFYGKFLDLDPVATAIIALMCFFVITPYIEEPGMPFSRFLYDFTWLSAKGLFVAIIVAGISTRIVYLCKIYKIYIKMPAGVPEYVEKSFASLIPAFFAVAVFTIIAVLFANSSYGSVHQLIFEVFQKPLLGLGESFWAYLIATIFIQLLWWFGIHGMNVVGAVMMPIWIGLDMQRMAALQAGQEVTNFMGTSFMTAVGQSTVAILLTVLLVCKSKQLREVAKIGMPAAVFNIGEPMVFGLPTVLNPIMFIPTVLLIPIVTNAFMLLGFVSGFVPPLSGAQIPMQMPVILYGLVQGNWQLAIWQLLEIPLAMVIVYPFLKIYDKQILSKSENNK